MNSRMQEKYRKETTPALMKRFGLNNVMAVPKVSKVTVNIGLGEASQNVKLLDTAAQELGQITGQKPVITRAKKSIANFKIRKGMGGQSTYLPLRVNSGGVIPPIFASSLLAFPATLGLLVGSRWAFVKDFADKVKWGEPLYTLLYVTLILLFAFFYVGIVFNPTELADNM